MKRLLSFLAAALLVLSFCLPAPAEGTITEAVLANPWYSDERAKLSVGNPTPLRGRFFTGMWGGTTSDIDVRELLHAYSPVLWDEDSDCYRFDNSVVENALIMTDGDGNRVYLLSFRDDLHWSDGTMITAKDYAFSMLLQVDPAVKETGGTPVDCSWLAGIDEYLSGETKALSGVKIFGGDMLQITAKAESLPYFFELTRLDIHPYPIDEIAPDTEVLDDGEGVYLSVPLTADTLRQTVLDEETGYMSHPKKVSGPYLLESYDGKTVKAAANPYFKGTEAGLVPHIGRIVYFYTDNSNMIYQLESRAVDLLDKVTKADSVRDGIRAVIAEQGSLDVQSELRSGLTLIWFAETSEKVWDKAVRQAVACSFDRDTFIKEYAGPFGIRTDGYYGQGMWMYRVAAELADYPVVMPGKPTKEDREAYNAAIEEWKSVNLDGLITYRSYAKLALKMLDMAGWNLNGKGEAFAPEKDEVRCKQVGEELVPLELVMAVPEAEDPSAILEKTLVKPLKALGISLTLVPASMEVLQEAYEGRNPAGFDMLYLGEDFAYVYDGEKLAPRVEAEGSDLYEARKECWELAQEMVRTEPDDLLGYVKKWVTLQEKITETLPLIPVYSNTYFDFFTRRLHDYDITKTVTWSEAIVKSYMSDIEQRTEKETKDQQNKLDKLNSNFD